MNDISDVTFIQDLQAAITYHQTGNAEQAQNAYRNFLEKCPSHPIALNNLSLLVSAQEAIDLLNQALERVPEYLDGLINISLRFRELGLNDSAADYALRAQKIDSQDPRVTKLIDALELANDKRVSEGIENSSLHYSVIIPTHKRARLLERNLKSIKSQSLAERCEIIVVSDCADDATDDVCRRNLTPADTYIRRSGRCGPSESRNLGLKLAKGDVVLFLDDDDQWNNNFLESLDASRSIREGRITYFDCTVVTESRYQDRIEIHEQKLISNCNRLTDEVYVKNQLSNSCIAYPIARIRNLTFDPHLHAYEDWDFLLSACEVQRPVYEPIVGPIIHEVRDSTTDRRGSTENANNFHAVLDYLYIYRRHPVSPQIQEKRAHLLKQVGLQISSEYL